jgi:tetratricopeptide (TPR) repeat protein
MLALHRSGRQADALAAYQHARRVLRDELAVRPGHDLERLHQRMLEADPLLYETGNELKPGPWADRGPERVIPAQLPAAIRHFTGRANELTALTSLIPGDTAVTGPAVIAAIAGTAGIGKTTLALHFAHQVAGRFPDGQLYVNLRGFAASGSPMPPAEAIRGFLDAFGIDAQRIPASLDAQVALYRSILSGKRVLIVLDNARDAGHARPLLPGSSTCMAMVTSRGQLTSLVAADGAFLFTLDFLTTDEARDLLLSMLGPQRLARESLAVDELITHCARLPLALSIAAARAAARPRLQLAALVSELRNAEERLSALDAGDAAANVRAAFSWSYQSLSDSAASAFRMLSLHPGPDITVAAVASLIGSSERQARMALAELREAHLLTEHLPGRFTFHDLLRAYAAEQIAGHSSDAQRRAAIHRLLDHYLHTAHVAALLMEPTRYPLTPAPHQPGVCPERITGSRQALAWFEAEHQVLLTAVRQAADLGFDTHTWQLSSTLARFLDSHAYWREWVLAARTGLSAAERLGDQAAQADAHHRLGCALAAVGADAEAERHMLRAVSLYQGSGDLIAQANTHISLSAMLGDAGRYRTALRHARHGLTLAQAAANRPYAALALNAVGWYRAMLGDFRHALSYCEEAVNLHRELGNGIGEANAWDSLGYAHHNLGQSAQAVTCYQRAVELRGEFGQRYRRAKTLIRLGEVHTSTASTEAARDAWELALSILDEMGHPDGERIRVDLNRLPAERTMRP